MMLYKALSGFRKKTEYIICVYLSTKANCFLISLDWCIIVYRTKFFNYFCLFLLKS